jgi:hypothetical protein
MNTNNNIDAITTVLTNNGFLTYQYNKPEPTVTLRDANGKRVTVLTDEQLDGLRYRAFDCDTNKTTMFLRVRDVEILNSTVNLDANQYGALITWTLKTFIRNK